MSKYMRLRKAAMLPKDEIELADADDAIVELRALLAERDRAVEQLRSIIIACEHKDIEALTRMILRADAELGGKR